MPLIPYPDDMQLDRQAVESPTSKRDGQSGAWHNNTWPMERLWRQGEPTSLMELFDQSVARHPNRTVINRIPILTTHPTITYGTTLIPTSYAALQARRDNLGSALLALERTGRLKSTSTSVHSPTPVEITHPGVPYYGSNNRLKGGARRGWGVGVWSKNREEWQVVDLATQAYGLVGVSLYETLGPDVAKYITNHCPLSIVFSAANHITDLLKIAHQCPTLRIIVSMDPLPPAEKAVLVSWSEHAGVELLDMVELERWGSEDGVKLPPGPVQGAGDAENKLMSERVVTVSYTSGTTGDPKGVILTDANIRLSVISNALGCTKELSSGEEFRFLAFMPLSHIYERFLEILMFYGDGTICYTTGDTLRLLDDAQLIKPDFMAGVPRIWNRIHAAVKTQMSAGGLKGALLNKAVSTKLANWRESGEVTHTLYDLLVFRKIRKLLGGNIKYISSGAAPLTADVHEMLKICFSCDVIQGYGLTETVGTCSKGVPFDVGAVGTCGQIQPCNEAKVVDVPEMGYTSNDKPNPRGELLLRGVNITPGYLHDPTNTKKLLDPDGWMHTGDIAEIDSCGRIKIVDRVKNVVKLSQGRVLALVEYVALEKLEGMYALNPLFASLLVHGDSTRSSIIALAVLDPAQAAGVVQTATGQSVRPGDLAGLEKAVNDKRVRKEVLRGLAKIAKKNKLNGFEMIKGIHLTVQPFPDHLLTPTLKVKRNVAAKEYKAQIDAAYEEAEAGGLDGGDDKAKAKL